MLVRVEAGKLAAFKYILKLFMLALFFSSLFFLWLMSPTAVFKFFF